MSGEMKRTQTPLSIFSDNDKTVEIWDAYNRKIAVLPKDQYEFAEFIVRAVNHIEKIEEAAWA